MSQENVELFKLPPMRLLATGLTGGSNTSRTMSTTGRLKVQSMTVARFMARTHCALTRRTGLRCSMM